MSDTNIQNTDVQSTTQAEATRGGALLAPAVDIFENENSITLLADMPGVPAERLEVDLNEGVLTITGRTQVEESGKEDAVFREFVPTTYQRKFTLSQGVDQAKIEARLDDGVLRLELPKAERAKPRKIEIKT